MVCANQIEANNRIEHGVHIRFLQLALIVLRPVEQTAIGKILTGGNLYFYVDDALVAVSCLDIQYGFLVVEVLFQVVGVKYVDADDRT